MFDIENDNLSFSLSLSSGTLRVYALSDDKFFCYIGPVIVDTYYEITKYDVGITKEEYARFISMLLRVALFSVSLNIENRYYIDYIAVNNLRMNNSKYPDSFYEWYELVSDKGLKSFSDYELCNYFKYKPHTLASFSALFAKRLYLYALESVHSVFNELHSPNAVSLAFLYKMLTEIKNPRHS